MDGSPSANDTLTGCGPLVPPWHDPHRSIRQSTFEAVRAHGQISRAQVAKKLGVSPASVSAAVSALVETGYLQTCQTPDSSDPVRGRPAIAIEVRPDIHLVAGVKLADRTHTAILTDFAGRRLGSASCPSEPGPSSVDAQIDAVATLLDKLLTPLGISRSSLSAVGLGIPGFVEHKTGIVHWSPVLDTRELPLALAASDALDLPVVIDNDANLVALAELWFGVGREAPDLVVVTIEQGVGAGVVLNHRLFRGSHGFGAELGHTKVHLDGALCRCGQRGCLEAYVADYALAREAAAAIGSITADTLQIPQLIETLFVEARSGNAAATSIFHRAGRYLAVGLANMVNLFDPSLIILAGDRMQYDYLYAEETLAEMGAFTLTTGRSLPPVEVHEWGSLLWAHGAAALALDTVTTEQLSGSA